MLRRFRTLIVSLALVFGVATPLLATTTAAAYNPFGKVCNNGAANDSVACKTTGDDPIGGKNGILYKVSLILSLIAAVGAVIIIIIGAFMYVVSAGDANKAANARRTMISAAIGLLVIGFAQGFIALIINIVK